MQTFQSESKRNLCPRCGKEKRYDGHDFDDEYLWKYDNWECECGARGFDVSRVVYEGTDYVIG